MKKLLGPLSIGVVLLTAVSAAGYGSLIMAYNLFTGGNDFTHGFIYFSLGFILAIGIVCLYTLTQILDSNKELANAVTELLLNAIDKNKKDNPINSLFGSIGVPLSGIIKTYRTDTAGNPVSSEINFNSQEEYFAHRDAIIAKLFGLESTEVKHTLEDMTIEDLQKREQQAVDNQDFESAAAIRDAIDRKKIK